jgi:hypothetical protein
MRAGDTFYLQDEEPKKHLWVIVSDPEADPLSVVFVSFTTRREKSDTTCVVRREEHPDLTEEESCIHYRFPRCEPLAKLTSMQPWSLRPKTPVSAELLERIRVGMAESDFTPLMFIRIMSQQGLIDRE